MGEYISREKLLKHLKECCEDELFDPDMKKAVFGIDIYIENMPAADVQPVKHGRWVSHKITASSKCSECNRVFVDETPYCPNCGARMDGDSKC